MWLFVLFLVCAVDLTLCKNFDVRCNNDSSRRGMSFQPVGGEFWGRYTVELCTEVNPNYTEWETVIYYYNNTTICPPKINLQLQHNKKVHSTNIEYTKFDSNCSNVCLTKEFDLIFRGCYTIDSKFLIGGKGPRYKTYNFNVTSLFTIAQIKANKPSVYSINHDDNLTITWQPGVPPTDYKVEMCEEVGAAEPQCRGVRCVQPDWLSVRCAVRRPARCVHFTLAHSAPWIAGLFHPQEMAPYKYCPAGAGAGAVLVARNNWTVVGWALGLAVLGLLLLLLYRCCRSPQARHFQRLVHMSWLKLSQRNTRANTMDMQLESMKSSRYILLVYARENAAGQRVVDALKTVLEHYIEGQVLDLYCARVVRAAAPAAGAWLRGMAARSDVSILLLQTPALHALYGSTVPPAGPITVSAPLFPSRLAYREPTFGDSLVPLVLRLLPDTQLAHHYRRVYIADLTELPVEVVPSVVPYRRYRLPRDLALLARDMAGAPPPAAAPPSPGEGGAVPLVAPPPGAAPLPGEEELLAAHRHFVDTVNENPAYLMDELVPVDEDTSDSV